MKSIVGQAAILTAVALGIALADGAFRGFEMPPKATQSNLPASVLSARPATAPLPSPASPEAPPPAADSTDPDALSVQDFYAAWSAGTISTIDARPLADFVESHIPNAFSLPFEDFGAGTPALLEMLPADRPVVVYCDGGDCHASDHVASMLLQYGFKSVVIFRPGFPSWVAAGYPAEAGEPLQ